MRKIQFVYLMLLLSAMNVLFDFSARANQSSDDEDNVIVKAVVSNYKDYSEKLTFNSTTALCNRQVSDGDNYKIHQSSHSESSSSIGCKAIYIAREIELRLKTIGKTCGTAAMVIGNFEKQGQMVRTGSDEFELRGMNIGASSVQQSCICGKFTISEASEAKKILFSLNLLETLFNGPYHGKVATLSVVSADECTQFFETEAEKEIVRAAYKNYGL